MAPSKDILAKPRASRSILDFPPSIPLSYVDCHLKECYKEDLELLDLRKVEIPLPVAFMCQPSRLYDRRQNVTLKSPPRNWFNLHVQQLGLLISPETSIMQFCLHAAKPSNFKLWKAGKSLFERAPLFPSVWLGQHVDFTSPVCSFFSSSSRRLTWRGGGAGGRQWGSPPPPPPPPPPNGPPRRETA